MYLLHKKDSEKHIESFEKFLEISEYVLNPVIALLLLATVINFTNGFLHPAISYIHNLLLVFGTIRTLLFLKKFAAKHSRKKQGDLASDITLAEINAVTFDKNGTVSYNNKTLTYYTPATEQDYDQIVDQELSTRTKTGIVERLTFLRKGIGLQATSIVIKDAEMLASTFTMFSFKNERHYRDNNAPIKPEELTGQPSQHLYIDSFCINNRYSDKTYMTMILAIFCKCAGQHLCTADHYTDIVIYARVKPTQELFRNLLTGIGFNTFKSKNHGDPVTIELRLTNEDDNVYSKKIFDWTV